MQQCPETYRTYLKRLLEENLLSTPLSALHVSRIVASYVMLPER